jgi:hypothetical protein
MRGQSRSRIRSGYPAARNSSQTKKVPINVGREVPAVALKTRAHDETVEAPNPLRWRDVSPHDIFKGKRIVIFG